MPKTKGTNKNSGVVSSRSYDSSQPEKSQTNTNNSSSSSSADITSTSSGLTDGPNSKDVLSESDLHRKALELVQYFLIADQKKIPIRKMDINIHILKEHKKHFPAVIRDARKLLLSIFGVDLIELDEKMKGRYILVKHKHEGTVDNLDTVCTVEEQYEKMGLLFIILAIIYMNGDIIPQTDLWKTLKKLGVDPDCRHDSFGDVKKLVLDEFVKQAYLDHVKVRNSEPPTYELHLGQRTKKEVKKKDILKYISKLYGKEPAEWKTLWQECVAEEQEAETPMEIS